MAIHRSLSLSIMLATVLIAFFVGLTVASFAVKAVLAKSIKFSGLSDSPSSFAT